MPRRSLLRAGVRREDLVTTTAFAAHQLSSVRIGELPGADPGLYCMDASVIPEAWGKPPMVTIVAMAKRLARHPTAVAEKNVAVQDPA